MSNSENTSDPPIRRNPLSSQPELDVDSRSRTRQLGAAGRFFVILLFLIALVLAFYGEEKIRGSWALHRAIGKLKKQGISLEFKQLNVPAIPAPKNFARTELLKPLYDFTSAQTNRDPQSFMDFEERWASLKNEVELKGFNGFPGGPGNWRKSEWPDPTKMLGEPNMRFKDDPPTDDQAFQLILDLYQQTTGPLLDELKKEAKARTTINFDIPLDVEMPFAILLPHLAKLKMLEQQISIRAMAELYFKKTDLAFEDAQFGLFLSEGMKSEPFLISGLVRIAMRELAITPFWYGLATHQWNTNQLLVFQRQFEGVDVGAEMRQALKGEMIAANRTIETFRRRFPGGMSFSTLGELADPSHQNGPEIGIEKVLNWVYPKGWLSFELANYLEIFNKHILTPAMDTRNGFQVKPAAVGLEKELGASPISRLFRHTLLASMLIPALEKAMTKAANSQTSHNLAAIACALERFRLDKGRYPEALAELTPQYKERIPNDVMTGKGLIYRRNADGTFILYSLGLNGIDDGGTTAIGKSGTVQPEEGDIVWKYPSEHQDLIHGTVLPRSQ